MKLCYVGDEGRGGLFSEECQQIICEVSIVEESGSTVLLVLTLFYIFFFQFQQQDVCIAETTMYIVQGGMRQSCSHFLTPLLHYSFHICNISNYLFLVKTP